MVEVPVKRGAVTSDDYAREFGKKDAQLEMILDDIHKPPANDRILLDHLLHPSYRRERAHFAKLAALHTRLYAAVIPLLYRHVTWPKSWAGSRLRRAWSARLCEQSLEGRSEARFRYIRALTFRPFDRDLSLFDFLGMCDRLRSVFMPESLAGLTPALVEKLLIKFKVRRLPGLYLSNSEPRALEFAVKLGSLKWLYVEDTLGRPSEEDNLQVSIPLRVQMLENECHSPAGIGTVKWLSSNTSHGNSKALGLYDLQNRDGIAGYIYAPDRPLV